MIKGRDLPWLEVSRTLIRSEILKTNLDCGPPCLHSDGEARKSAAEKELLLHAA